MLRKNDCLCRLCELLFHCWFLVVLSLLDLWSLLKHRICMLRPPGEMFEFGCKIHERNLICFCFMQRSNLIAKWTCIHFWSRLYRLKEEEGTGDGWRQWGKHINIYDFNWYDQICTHLTRLFAIRRGKYQFCYSYSV